MDDALRRHWSAFGLVHGYLDLSVSRAFARLDEACRKQWWRGSTLSTLVRNIFLDLADNPVMAAASLELVERPNVGLRLIDWSGLKVRVRRWPVDLRSHRPVPVTQPPVDTLFGIDWDAAPFELIVLWRPDRKGQVLGSVSLAAVANIDEPHRVAIYAESALPLATSATLPGGQRTGGPESAAAPSSAMRPAAGGLVAIDRPVNHQVEGGHVEDDDFEDGGWPAEVSGVGGPDSA